MILSDRASIGNQNFPKPMKQRKLFNLSSVNSVESSSENSHQSGEMLREEALKRLEQTRADYLPIARRAFVKILLEKNQCTLDDVREVVELPSGVNPSVNGAVPRLSGIIAFGEYVSARRPTAHASKLVVWKLVDRDLALQWLKDHPAPSDSGPREGGVK